MRKNLPVTNREYVLRDDQTIVSKTDLRGKITYINRDFMEVSGFATEELIGVSQNIIRHPDMPPEAFEDLWRSLKAGKAWNGLVKNRCKNGDHYWVEANVAPLLKDGQMVGYTSIRVKPTRDKVAAAEKAYAAISGGDRSLLVREGRVKKDNLLFRISERFIPSLGTKLHIITGITFVALLCNLITSASTKGVFGAITMLITILAMLTTGILIYGGNTLIGAMKRTREDIDKMSAGDLTGTIEAQGNDEFSKLLRALQILQINVKLIIGQIKETSDVLSRGTADIASGNADLSARTESQASSLEETAASMEELTGTVRQNADNANEANKLVQEASGIANDGGDAVNQVVSMMSAIKSSSDRIVDIIAVIDGIAFQTNILALNAAVEAARAGEQGRGFAVVAAEVRTLAQRSASAAKEIKELITDSVQKIQQGNSQANYAGSKMAEIVAAIGHVTQLVSDISHASQEQSSGIEQVNQAITQMDEATQQNAALVEEAAASAESMRGQAEELKELLTSFRLVPGNAPASWPHAVERASLHFDKNVTAKSIGHEPNKNIVPMSRRLHS